MSLLINLTELYFTGIAQSLERKIPHTTTSFEKYIPLTSLESFGLSITSPEEIIRLGSTMRISQGKGVDDISPVIAVSTLASIAHDPLSEIINCSFSTGVFHDALKIAKVVPIFKRGLETRCQTTDLFWCCHSSPNFLKKLCMSV